MRLFSRLGAREGRVPESASMQEADAPDDQLEAALRRIRERIAARTRNGTYPIGLDDELDGHFDRLAAMGRLDDVDAAATTVDRLRSAPRLAVDRIPTGSRVPGGHVLHRSIQTVVGRQLVGVLDQVELFRQDVIAALEAILQLVEPMGPTSGAEIASRLSALADRVSRVDQVLVSLRDLEGRVVELEAGPVDPPT